MKGIILAGGTGFRLHPFKKITNNHLLSVSNKAVIYCPIEKFTEVGIQEILIREVSGFQGYGIVESEFEIPDK